MPAVHVSSDEISSGDDDDDSEDGEDYSFTVAEGQDVFEEWIAVQRRETRQMFAVRLMDLLITDHNYLKTKAAEESANVIGVNEKTVRRWHTEFYSSGGCFKEDDRGVYERLCVLSDENCRKITLEWVRCNAYKKGEPIMTASDFLLWINNTLLPQAQLPPGYPQQISLATAKRWLHSLGFHPTPDRKGLYIDGHERPDVVEYRRIFLKKLNILHSTHLPPPVCDDGVVSKDLGSPNATKKLVLIFHDESIYHSNEDQGWQWTEKNKVTIKPKGKGRGLMVSDFIDEFNGFLRLSDEEAEEALKHDRNHPVKARVILKYGAQLEGYWDSNKFMAQVKQACTIAEYKYPRETHSIVWLFDQSCGHCAYAEDALNINRMNVKPGGKQAKLRDTINPLNGRPQKLVDSAGIPKGMKNILEERGVDTSKMKAERMKEILRSHHDFKYEKTKVERYLINEKKHRVLFIPKYHCEFNPIERVWGQSKKTTRATCNYSFQQLEKMVEPALDRISVSLIRKYYRKARDFMLSYENGVTDALKVLEEVKLYKSHRRVPQNM